MKLKIKETTEKEIEFELPYYVTSGVHSFRFDENQNCICVYIGSKDCFEIQKLSKDRTPEEWYFYPQITKEEFEAKFNEALKLIQDEIKN